MNLDRSLPKGFQIDLIRAHSGSGEFGALLDRAFHYPDDHHYLIDFSVWNPLIPVSGRILLGIRNEATGEIVSSVGVRSITVRCPASRELIPAAIIGAVATAQTHQGHGLAVKLIDAALLWAKERGARFVALWGSAEKFYQKFGFELIAGQARMSLVEFIDDSSEDTLPIGRSFIHELLPLMQKQREHFGGTDLGREDLPWIEAQSTVEWFWIGSPKSPRAYLALGRGMDLGGIIHEWGGDPSALRELIRATLKLIRARGDDPSLLTMMGPEAALKELSPKTAMIQENMALIASLDKNPIPGDLWFWGLDAS